MLGTETNLDVHELLLPGLNMNGASFDFGKLKNESLILNIIFLYY
jgi:hypothetical protein